MDTQDSIFRNATEIAERQRRIGQTLQAVETKRIIKSLFRGLFRIVGLQTRARKTLR